MNSEDALRIAADAYEGSTSFIDSNYRKQWEEGLRLFQGRHPVDSKYNSDKYKHRSRLFRPKTRSGIRKLEAMAAMSFFSNISALIPIDLARLRMTVRAASTDSFITSPN